MIIRNNTLSRRAYNANRKTTNSIKKNLEKLSSGYRINRAADDVAGLGVSERIRAKVTELDRCEDNAAEGIDLARTADAALQEVNDMLKRARSLCIQAENGTYSDQELAAISDEMNQIFDEIDRISAGSYHNSINLFRPDIGQTYHEEYDEDFTPLEDLLQIWGQMEFIESDKFDEAVDAVPATTTFELDDFVDPADPKTMEGKALQIGSYTYYFTENNTQPSGTYIRKVSIASTMEQTLKNLVNASSDISSAIIDGRNVTLTAALRGLDYVTNDIPYTAPDGDAEWAHSTSVTSPTGVGTLKEIDGSGASNNAPVYMTPDEKDPNVKLPFVVLEYTLGKTGTISGDDIKNLNQNSFGLNISRNGSTSFSRDVTVPFSSFGLGGAVTTWEQFGQKLAEEISKQTNYTASYSGGKLTVNYNAGNSSPVSLRTSVQTGTTGGTPSQTLKTWTSQGINFTVKQDNQGGMEAVEQCSVEIPALDGKIPFSFSVNGYSYLYYNPNDPSYTAFTDQDGVSLTTSSSSYVHSVGSSVSQAEIANDIRSQVQSAMGSRADVRVEGNKLVITAKHTNTGSSVYNSLRTVFGTTTHNIYAVKAGTSGTSSKPVIPSTTTYSKAQDVTVTFDIGSDVKGLEGKGFSVGGTRIEFINSDNHGSIRNDYSNDIDLKTLTTMEDVRSAIASRFGSSYTVALNGSKLSISKKTSPSSASYYNTVSVTDGILGMEPLSKGGAVKFGGGVNVGQSQKAIDFSSINEDNIDTLLGKGFRIDCATCSGEYINVFFCWSNDGSVPATFERQDPVTGLTRTIHNIPVELSKVTSGDRIVEDIVRQVRPTLRHYTDVAVGDPPTILLAMEKRLGDVVDENGNLYLGKIETGVEVNFTYNVEHKLVPDLPEGDLDKLKTAVVNIYVGSDPEPQLIPIHLPYIDMAYLRLRPPKLVDLTDPSQSPSDWLGRVDRADLAISDARGTIGADYNRLEHAVQDLSNAHIQLSDAYSVIRDADVAELMMKQVKDQIILQAQQSMLSQANQVPQGVLQLMQ
ncbi:MAG: flagellin [Oscillospiraceae bacterium]|nr:flagellin [Oscillospiraceae bacterium]